MRGPKVLLSLYNIDNVRDYNLMVMLTCVLRTYVKQPKKSNFALKDTI